MTAAGALTLVFALARNGRPMTSDTPLPHRNPSAELQTMNERLAAWAACTAEDSPALIERFEAMGYAVRGKSREEVEAALRCPPERVSRGDLGARA
jgi:hypothetical protein